MKFALLYLISSLLLILLPLQVAGINRSAALGRLLPELREHPGGLSPTFCISKILGKSDIGCIWMIVLYKAVQASTMLWLFALVLVLNCGFIIYVFVYDFFNFLL